MSDLFESTQSRVPAYGSISPRDEYTLYLNDRYGWYQYVAETMGRKIIRGGADTVRMAWSQMSSEYRRHVWNTLSDADRAFVRAALAIAEPVAA